MFMRVSSSLFWVFWSKSLYQRGLILSLYFFIKLTKTLLYSFISVNFSHFFRLCLLTNLHKK
jgi:hypothetical protein